MQKVQISSFDFNSVIKKWEPEPVYLFSPSSANHAKTHFKKILKEVCL